MINWVRHVDMVGSGEIQDMVWECKQQGLDLRSKGEWCQGHSGVSNWVGWSQLLKWGTPEERQIWGLTKCEIV